ncbi:MAG: cytochrome c [Deltaproteobacteria bacterium]|nr:cytochrome c [Deltaproteobacteria bacterium]
MTVLRINSFLIFVVVAALLGGCRGQVSDKAPIHPHWNMDNVKRFDAQEPTDFFADGRTSRAPVEGTIAVGQLREDTVLQSGVDANGDFVSTMPSGIALTAELLDRGEGRYNIYCAPCHDKTGSGNGIVRQRGFIPPPSFQDARVRQFPIGQIVNAQSAGVRTMPSYAPQIPAEDRWAVAAYVRALQISQGATLAQVPADVAKKNGW